jgi:hypothetical protein
MLWVGQLPDSCKTEYFFVLPHNEYHLIQTLLLSIFLPSDQQSHNKITRMLHHPSAILML